jgi:phage regulator Rha-like protein
MEKMMVEIKNEDLFVGTWDLSKGFDVEHRILKKLIKHYETDFQGLGAVALRVQQPTSIKGGGIIREYILNEMQATYLTTLLQNNDKVRKFKMKLTKQFYDQRKLLYQIITQKQNKDWEESRISGKKTRRIETDAIKEFIEYAKTQGSKSADKYYMIITKMENQSMLHLDLLQQEFPNLRQIADVLSLMDLSVADRIVAVALREGMKGKMFYKDIYLMARDRIEGLALSMGKTPLRLALKEKVTPSDTQPPHKLRLMQHSAG